MKTVSLVLVLVTLIFSQVAFADPTQDSSEPVMRHEEPAMECIADDGAPTKCIEEIGATLTYGKARFCGPDGFLMRIYSSYNRSVIVDTPLYILNKQGKPIGCHEKTTKH